MAYSGTMMFKQSDMKKDLWFRDIKNPDVAIIEKDRYFLNPDKTYGRISV